MTDEGIAVTQGKTGARLIYLWDAELRTVVARIKAMRRPRGPHRTKTLRRPIGLHLFCTRAGQPYTASGFDSIWQRAMKKALGAGVIKERFTEHDIRAKTATDDPLSAQQRLGHKNRSMTDRYIKVRKVEKVKPLAKNI